LKYLIIPFFCVLIRCSTFTSNEDECNKPVIDGLRAELGYSDFNEKAHFATDQTITTTKEFIINSLGRDPNEYLYTAFFYAIDDDTIHNTMTIYDKRSLVFDSAKERYEFDKVQMSIYQQKHAKGSSCD